MLCDDVPCVPFPATTSSDEEDNSDSSTKPIRSEKKKNPASLFQTGGDPPKEKKTKKKGESLALGTWWVLEGLVRVSLATERGCDQRGWCGSVLSWASGFNTVQLLPPSMPLPVPACSYSQSS